MLLFSDEPVGEFFLYAISSYCDKSHWELKETYLSTLLGVSVEFVSERELGIIHSFNCYEHMYRCNANGMKESELKRKLREIFGNRKKKYESWGDQKAVFNGKEFI